MDWTRVPHDERVFGGPGDQFLLAVVPDAEDGFVAGGWDASGGDRDAAFWTSDNGRSWRKAEHVEGTFGGPGVQSVRSIIRTADGYLAAGSDASGDGGRAAVWTSRDGRDWERISPGAEAFDAPGAQRINALTRTSDGYLGAGIADLEAIRVGIWTSRDGTEWTPVDDPAVEAGHATAAVSDGERVVVAGWTGPMGNTDAAVWTSTGGRWRAVSDDDVLGGEHPQLIRGLAVGGPGFVAVGSDSDGADVDAAVWTSPDGVAWERVPHDEGLFGGEAAQVMFAVASTGDGLIAVGGSGADPVVWTSDDGIGWERHDLSEEESGDEDALLMEAVATGPSVYVIVGGGTDLVGQTATGAEERASVWVADRP